MSSNGYGLFLAHVLALDLALALALVLAHAIAVAAVVAALLFVAAAAAVAVSFLHFDSPGYGLFSSSSSGCGLLTEFLHHHQLPHEAFCLPSQKMLQGDLQASWR